MSEAGNKVSSLEVSCVSADTGAGLGRSILKISSAIDNYCHI